MNGLTFLDVSNHEPERADALLLPLPFEGTVSYGTGTARGPEAVWRASAEVELWDEELGWELDALRLHSAPPVLARDQDTVASYLERARTEAARLHDHGGLVVGVGGEHSVTLPLVEAAAGAGDGMGAVTIVQIDAHLDLRASYQGTPLSHACVMRRLLDQGARVIAIGVRAGAREEWCHAQLSDRIQVFPAQRLAEDATLDQRLLQTLAGLVGDVYLTVDVDALDASLCPGTGTPEPGGLGWWQTLRYLRSLLGASCRCRLIGFDVVEAVPQAGTCINEFTAARLIAKILAYHFAPNLKARMPKE